MEIATPLDDIAKVLTIRSAKMASVGAPGWRIVALGVALAALAPGCFLGTIDQSGKSCPCTDQWECIEGRCVLCPRERDGAFAVDGFRGDWSTPNSIRWRWEPTGEEADFGSYEITISNSAEALCRGDAARYNAITNPELGRFRLPRGANAEADVVRGSIIRGLTPRVPSNEAYFARLTVTDNVAARWQSSVVRFSTLDEAVRASPLVLFEDEPRHNFTTPECLTVVDDEALSYEGPSHLEMDVVCETREESGTSLNVVSCVPAAADPPTQCWTAVRLGEVDVPIGPGNSGDFEAAFIELVVSLEQTEPVFIVEVGIDGEDGHEWDFEPMTIPGNTGYEAFQIPLSALVDRDFLGRVQPPPPRLTSWDPLGSTITSFRLGALWRHGGRVRLDSVRIVW